MECVEGVNEAWQRLIVSVMCGCVRDISRPPRWNSLLPGCAAREGVLNRDNHVGGGGGEERKKGVEEEGEEDVVMIMFYVRAKRL